MNTMERTAWLFTRGEESVRIEVRVTPSGVVLIIEGPGAGSSTHEFPPGARVDGFRDEHERTLKAEGYRLQVIEERRIGDEAARSGHDRRRRP